MKAPFDSHSLFLQDKMAAIWQNFWLKKATKSMALSEEVVLLILDVLLTCMTILTAIKKEKWFYIMEI